MYSPEFHNPNNHTPSDVDNIMRLNREPPDQALFIDSTVDALSSTMPEAEAVEHGSYGLDSLAEEPDFVDKVSMVPLQIDTVRGLLDQMAQDPAYSALGEERDRYGFELVQGMKTALEGLAQSARPGDSVTFDDLLIEAEHITGRIDRMGSSSVIDVASRSEFASVAGVTEKFATYFDQQPNLKYIADDVDRYTVHPDVHEYVKGYLEADKTADLHGREYGRDGAWIAQKRGDRTVWVSREQLQQEQKNLAISEAQQSVNRAFDEIIQDSAMLENRPTETLEEMGKASEGGTENLLDLVPDDKKERFVFGQNAFRGDYDPTKLPMFRAYLQKQLQGLVAEMPTGARYRDTVAAVVGNAGSGIEYLNMALSIHEQRTLDPSTVGRMPFSEAARKLGINVEEVVPDYRARFSSSEQAASAKVW